MKLTSIFLLGMISLSAQAESLCNSTVLANGVVFIDPIYRMDITYKFYDAKKMAKADVKWSLDHARAQDCISQYVAQHPGAIVVVPEANRPVLYANVVGSSKEQYLTLTSRSADVDAEAQIDIDYNYKEGIIKGIKENRIMGRITGDVNYDYKEEYMVTVGEVGCPLAGKTGLDNIINAYREMKQTKRDLSRSEFLRLCVKLKEGMITKFAGKNGLSRDLQIIAEKMPLKEKRTKNVKRVIPTHQDTESTYLEL
jgi:hypothetical protein